MTALNVIACWLIANEIALILMIESKARQLPDCQRSEGDR